MADLPPERVQQSHPFQHIGVDHFGPFTVVCGRRRLKRWVQIHVCCTMRGVHLEVTNDQTSDQFICALVRFSSRRGHPDSGFSDNARNILGATAELRECELWDRKVLEYAAQKGMK